MSMIKVNQSSNGQPVELFYQDIGAGSPVVLIHGWPVSHAMWEYQMLALVNNGYRVIAYDRRGFGHSSKPSDGYDYDTLADDLKGLLDGLDLENVSLVGFSMGGGEVARYMNRHRAERVSKVALISAVTPFMLKTSNNPDGVDQKVFSEMQQGLQEDRFDFLSSFGKDFFGVTLINNAVSAATLNWAQNLAAAASPIATLKCVEAFSHTDFRKDLLAIQVPTLIIHGDDDKTVPIAASGDRTAELLSHADYKVYEGAPHGLFITHKDLLNRDLVEFLNAGQGQYANWRLQPGESALTQQPRH
ncbi:MAG TPA: alpha/beta hydrolase [Methylophilaceae bacterium]|nr:alpha/beta hydrolase [Methylophilaceae bacterium]